MPNDRIEAAIKRASDKDAKGYEEHLYEGYGPHGVPILIETATDNTNRTVANVRSYFSKAGGTLGKTGSLDFIFQRKSVFRFAVANDMDLEELELELIDGGLEERSEEHTSELQSLMRISYAVFCLKKKNKHNSNEFCEK